MRGDPARRLYDLPQDKYIFRSSKLVPGRSQNNLSVNRFWVVSERPAYLRPSLNDSIPCQILYLTHVRPTTESWDLHPERRNKRNA